MLFVHDHKFYVCGDEVYTAGSLTDALFKRYEDVFGEVSVLANRCDLSEKKDMPRLSPDRKMHLYPKRNILGIGKAKRIRELVKNEKYIVLRLPSINGILVGLASLFRKKDYMVELVGCPKDALSNHGLTGKLVMPFVTFFTKVLVKRASHVLYVTDVFLQSRYPTKGKAIGCSDVLLDEEYIASSPKSSKQKDQTLILGTAGALDVRYKGQEYVIAAIPKLNEQGIRVEYKLAGSGTGNYLRETADQLGCKDQVKICGLLDCTAIKEFYSSLDVYIQPSLTEGMPRAVIEAMSSGCYCIGTNVGGIPELVGESSCFEKANVKDIVCKISQYYDVKADDNRLHCLSRSRDFIESILKGKREKFYNEFKSYVDSLTGK